MLGGVAHEPRECSATIPETHCLTYAWFVDDAQAKLFCQIVGQLIIADEEVTDEEHDFLESLMARFGLSEEAKADVVDGIGTGGTIDAAVAQLGDEAKMQLIDELVTAATSDGTLAGSEAKLIQSVRDALGTG